VRTAARGSRDEEANEEYAVHKHLTPRPTRPFPQSSHSRQNGSVGGRVMPPPSAAQNYDSVDSQRGERLLTHTQFAATFRSTATLRPSGMLNTVLTPAPIPPRPKPGPIGTCEELAQHQLRLQLMVFMLCKSMSYRAIARELGVARTTVMRMAPEAARFSAFTDCFVNMLLPTTGFETSETERGVDNNSWVRGNSDGG
jgi:hypothetical protein